MKLKLLLIALLFLSIKGFTQDATKVFDDVKDVTVRNFGPIKQNNIVKGYYGFYEFDKVDKKTILFKLSILDENLNVIGVKDIEGPKDWSLLSSGFDGNNFCFKFYDEKSKSIELHVYDQQAKEVSSSSLKITYKVTNDKYLSFNAVVGPDVDVVGHDGFCDYTFNEPNNSFITTYANGSNQTSWQQTYEPETKAKAVVPKFLAGDNEMILTGISKIDKGLYSLKTEESIVAVSTKNGNQLFDVSTDFGDNHVVPINAIFEDGKITVVGLNYSTNKTYTSAPEGLAFLQIDKTGKVLSSSFKTFEESFGKYLPIQDHELQGGYYLYFHNIVRTNKNTNVIIAEKFKKVADAGGIALSLISSAAGPIKLQLENMVVLEYDIAGNIISAKEIPKLVGSTVTFPSYSGFLPSYYLAKNADAMGLMDYKFTTTNTDNSEVTFSFVDYGKIDEASEKTANFGQIKFKDGNITVDKLPIKNSKATFSSFYQAKPNHVLQINYFKKDKKLEMNLIKLNN